MASLLRRLRRSGLQWMPVWLHRRFHLLQILQLLNRPPTRRPPDSHGLSSLQMKTNLSARSVLLFALACLLGAFAVAPISGCAFLSKTKAALTGSDAVLTCKVVGDIANTLADDVAKLAVTNGITPAHAATFGADFDKFQAAYRTEVNSIEAAHADLAVPASSPLLALFNQLEADYSALK